MPMHDWSRVKAGTYHNFHYFWLAEIARELNRGLLPDGYFAMAEQKLGGREPDVVTLSVGEPESTRANRIAIHHVNGSVVAVIELVSPGNKDSKRAMRQFASKTTAFIHDGIHVLVVDPFPPARFDPHGIHRAVWEKVSPTVYEQPASQPLTAISYESGSCPAAYVEPFAVGDRLPDMPLFLIAEELHVMVSLEKCYQQTRTDLPKHLQVLIASGK